MRSGMVLALGLFTFSASAGQGRLLAVNIDLAGTANLWQIDEANAAATKLGRIDGVIGPLGSLEYGPDGNLYAISVGTDLALYRIDPIGLEATRVGPIGFNVLEGSLAFSPGGASYASWTGDLFSPRLFSVDLTTGEGSIVVNLGGLVDLSGLAWREDGMLVGIDLLTVEERIVEVDPSTGMFVELAPLISDRDDVASGMTVLDGFGYFTVGFLSSPRQTQLWRLDLDTGEQTLVGLIGDVRISGLAAIPGSGAILGDMNCDGLVTPGDIAGFVLALTDPGEYGEQFPECSILNADINGDGLVTPGDIAGFVEVLSSF